MKKIVCILLGCFFVSGVLAIEVPKELVGKTVTLVVPYPPGGGTDSTQRIIADQAQHISGINFIVVNKAGALGTIGANHVADSPANGLTLLAHANETLVLNPVMQESNAVPPARLQPVVIHALTPQFFYTGYNNQIKNLRDLVQQARTNPKFTVGYSSSHMQLYLTDFFNRLGIKPYMVRFKGVPDMAISAFQQEIDLFGADAVSGLAHVSGSKTRAIATTWTGELSIYPGAIPANTVAPGFKTYNIQMISAPADTPKHIVLFYNQLFREAARTSDAQKKWSELQIILQDLNVTQTENFIVQERQKEKQNWGLINQ